MRWVNRLRKQQAGVALLFFIMLIGVFLGFMMLVVNTGMLVYQKIRLQSAVDVAAYAGASVQASYLGNSSSGEQSINRINNQILKRYGKLLKDLQFGSRIAWPQGIPNFAACAAVCAAASLANGQYTERLYKQAAADIEDYRNQIIAILKQMPVAARKAAEETIKQNIPDLEVKDDFVSSLSGETTNDVNKVVESSKEAATSIEGLDKKKNAILSFSSAKGMYLANVVAPVPHAFAYYGPMCFNLYAGQEVNPYYYCAVNGQGAPGGSNGYQAAALAFAKVYAPAQFSGNIGNIKKISDRSAKGIRLQFIQNPHKPEPFVVVSAEWYPKNGSAMNLENSLGVSGSLFPKQTRLVAVAAAEPFGGALGVANANIFGTRLQSIRKLLLNPKMKLVKDDFQMLDKYMETLAPLDDQGRPTEQAEDVIRRFLH